MLSADAAFENAADAAAAAFARAPAIVSYRVREHAEAEGEPPLDETQRIVYRPLDPPTVQPLPPVVDALADWAFRFDPSSAPVRLEIAYEHPKSYEVPTPGPQVDVVVASVNGYAVSYAGPGHLRLEPVTPAGRDFARQVDHFAFRDVWFDQATWLPSRVVVASPDETLSLDYTVVAGHWLLAHMRYDAVARARGTAKRYLVEATFDQYDFPGSGAAAAPAPASDGS